MPPKLYRNKALHRLLVFPDDVIKSLECFFMNFAFFIYLIFLKKIPENIISNISEQIRPQIPVAKRLTDYSEQEISEFPRLFEW